MSKSRTLSGAKNVTYVMIGSIVNVVLQFVSRKFFVTLLTDEYLGLNGLFTDILNVLALSELGVGSAMVYALYKPVADQNREKIKSLMQLYKRMYVTIGVVIITVGSLLTPFLPILIKEMPEIPFIKLIYILYVLDSGISYFLVYKKSLIVCNQEEYLSSVVTMGISFLKRVGQIIILLLTHNYLCYLLVQIFCSLVENIINSAIANQKYPYLREKNIQPLSDADKKDIIKNIKALIMHKVGAVVVNSTDTLILSKVLGLLSVGLYSNYNLVLYNVSSILGKAFNSLTASFGNLVTEENKQKSKTAFLNFLFIDFWVYSFCSVCIYCLIEPFIEWWLGDRFLLGQKTVLVFVTYFFLEGIRNPALILRNATGVFEKDKYKAIVEAIVNLAVSIPLTMKFGLLGVKLGTIISLVFVAIIVEGIVLYKFYFDCSSIQYFARMIIYTIFTLILCRGTFTICEMVRCSLFVSLFVRLAICVVVPNIIIALVFHKTDEFTYVIDLVKKLFLARLKKQNRG